jgi:Fe2+ transport system protein B
MLYDVEQTAIKLNVSKMTIYNKIKLKEYRDKVIKKAGKTYIDEVLLNLIKDSIKSKNNVEISAVEEQYNQDIPIDDIDSLNLNKDLVNALLEQLRVKDEQIQELNNRLKKEQEAHEHTLLLFKSHQVDMHPFVMEKTEIDSELNLEKVLESKELKKEVSENKHIKKGIFNKFLSILLFLGLVEKIK